MKYSISGKYLWTIRTVLVFIIIVFLKFSPNAQETILATGGKAIGTNASIDYSLGQVFQAQSTGVDGSISCGIQQAYEISVIADINFSKLLSQGWTWFSINVDDGSMAINDVLVSLNPQENDYIKNQTKSAIFYPEFGWFGTLDHFLVTEMYKIKLLQSDQLEFSAAAANADSNPITINTGWNWVSYIPQKSQTVHSALSSLNAIQEDYIKNQTISSMYYESFGWFGVLEELSPTEGYMLKSANDGVLNYPNPDLDIKLYASITNPGLFAGPDFNPHNYEFNGSLTAEVLINGVNLGSPTNVLYAFVEDECRGKINGKIFPPSGQFVYELMIHSNMEEDEIITFKFYDQQQHKWYDISDEIMYKADMVLANAINPLQLKSNTLSTDEYHLRAYPNPVDDELILDINRIEDQNLTYILYDINSRIIDRKQITEKSTHISMIGLVPATYFLKIINNQTELKIFKIIKH